MNFNQLRFVRETVRQKFNLSVAAQILHTSQPGVSKGIIELEEELGVEIFVRYGKRIKGLTEPGRAILRVIERLLTELENLKNVGQEFIDQDSGNLTIATTHTQARYTLPRVISIFKKHFPAVRLSLLQGSPGQIAEMVLNGHADIAIATEGLSHHPDLLSLPCFCWEHAVVVPVGHALLENIKTAPLTLDVIAQYPIITYDRAFAGRTHIDQAFHRCDIEPDIVLEAIDADVIKTYVEIGLGVGILAGIAFDAKRDQELCALPAGHLFGKNTTFVAVKKGVQLRGFAYMLIELLAPDFERATIQQVLAGDSEA